MLTASQLQGFQNITEEAHASIKATGNANAKEACGPHTGQMTVVVRNQETGEPVACVDEFDNIHLMGGQGIVAYFSSSAENQPADKVAGGHQKKEATQLEDMKRMLRSL